MQRVDARLCQNAHDYLVGTAKLNGIDHEAYLRFVPGL
ncbi:hypothetical protein F4827_006020 [Paraburkholderia bannensis]|uniref:Uncharacterized protein n=1 Tax=Paraburkholderia bannensis TaxID=765414 RepID=A0A7W9U3B3_9BURK|nr:hypothetical protein [Paraburkholderia sp. WP4_3_2]MBB6106149.1 hypothetical protein [Paraburkholderia bannensis]